MNVSVIIPVYNAAAYLQQAVTSALEQPQVKEVVLIEDGSTDGSPDVCRRCADLDHRVRLLTHADGANHGPGASRNVGIRAARCPFIAFLDADDYYLPQRFAAAATCIADDPTLDGVYDAVGTTFESDAARQWYRDANRPDVTTVLEPVPPEMLFEVLVPGGRGWFCTDGIVVRRSLFDRTGLFDEDLRMCQDLAMWIRMAAFGRLAGGSMTCPVALRRVHDDNRIFRHRHLHAQWAARAHRRLLQWAHAQRLPRQRILLLVDALMHYALKAMDSEPPASAPLLPLRFRLHRTRIVACCAARYPDMLVRSAYMRRLLGEIVTGPRRVPSTPVCSPASGCP